jgi:hypothetical protein
MTYTLIRRVFREDGIFSELFDDKNNSIAVTLEHSYDNKPKVYDGTFTCIKGIHRLHDNIPFDAFEITGVNGHTGILFHVGNYNKDSDGCVLVGTDVQDTDSGRMVTHSMIAFSKFMAGLEGVSSFTLVVTSPSS